MTERKKEPFEIAPPPIPAEEIKETYNTDIVVVGAGTSGKASALSAAEAGARVIQIDKHITFRWGGGHIGAIDSRLQKKLGIKVDTDDICLQLMKWAGNKPNQRFYRLWAEHSGAVMDWLMDMTEAEGIETVMYQWPQPEGFDLKTEYYPEYPVCHWQPDPVTRLLNHSLVLNCAQKNALKLGVDIRYQTRGVQLIRQDNGRVTGIIAKYKGGNCIQFNAGKAVILCTGDYGNNPAMMERYCPVAADVARSNNIYMQHTEDLRAAKEPLNVGDGHRMAMWIGAVMEPDPHHAPVAHATVPPLGNGSFLRVNINGVRYENEDVPGQSIANSLVRQPGKRVWQIFDDKWEEELPRMGVGLGKFYEVNDRVRQRVAEGAFKAETLEKLADKIEVPYKTFKATVDRYNELARMGRDPDFAKNPGRLTTIEKPPFYASIIEQEFLVVLGGLNANIRFQPLDKDGKVIPGLYLGGNTVGNRFAVDYPTMCPGLTHGMAWTFGRLAGQYAAAEKT